MCQCLSLNPHPDMDWVLQRPPVTNMLNDSKPFDRKLSVCKKSNMLTHTRVGSIGT